MASRPPDAPPPDLGALLGRSTAATFAQKARDLESLRGAVVEAATVGTGLWVTYVLLLFYLLIATGGIRHSDLFLENPVKLPFLSVDLPIKAFFWVGPAIFLVMHAYVLVHFLLLAAKAHDFDEELQRQISDSDTRTRLRAQLPTNIFVQRLAGPRSVRNGVMGFLLRSMSFITLVIAPLALLSLFELQFLAYHDPAITWWHRVAIIADLSLIWWLWPSIARGVPLRHRSRPPSLLVLTLLSAVSIAYVLFVVAVARFPGEPQARVVAGSPIAWLHDWLVHGEPDLATRKLGSLWSDVLVLPEFDPIDHTKFDTSEKVEAARPTISLRGRHLEGAVLSNANLARADFTGAFLQRADLSEADLRGAKLTCVQYQGDPALARGCTSLQNVVLNQARLQGALLTAAHLEGALMIEAQLQGADLDGAHLQAADLERAHLEGATANQADFRGAVLDRAILAGIRLGAPGLLTTRFGGASLREAQLQGCDCRTAEFAGTDLSGAYLWRAVPPTQSPLTLAGSVRLQGATTEALYLADAGTEPFCPGDSPGTCRVAMSTAFPDLRAALENTIPPGNRRDQALHYADATLDPSRSATSVQTIAALWRPLASDESHPDRFVGERSAELQRLACEDPDEPYLVFGLVERLAFGPIRSECWTPTSVAPAWCRALVESIAKCPAYKLLTPAARSFLALPRSQSSRAGAAAVRHAQSVAASIP